MGETVLLGLALLQCITLDISGITSTSPENRPQKQSPRPKASARQHFANAAALPSMPTERGPCTVHRRNARTAGLSTRRGRDLFRLDPLHLLHTFLLPCSDLVFALLLLMRLGYRI